MIPVPIVEHPYRRPLLRRYVYPSPLLNIIWLLTVKCLSITHQVRVHSPPVVLVLCRTILQSSFTYMLQKFKFPQISLNNRLLQGLPIDNCHLRESINCLPEEGTRRKAHINNLTLWRKIEAPPKHHILLALVICSGLSSARRILLLSPYH